MNGVGASAWMNIAASRSPTKARQVRCPTLIVHARDDKFIPFDEGRLLAALIPNATLLALPCANHLPLENDPEWPVVLDEIKAFLAAGSTGASPHVDVPSGVSTLRLTVRQIEVVRLIGRGQTDKQIARQAALVPTRRVAASATCSGDLS
jgi:DNA-binding NarL/FixJ family response regulator